MKNNKLTTLLSKRNVFIAIENIDKVSSEEFSKLRNIGFGASDAAALLGVSPFTSPEQLVYEKAHMISDPTIGEKPSVRMGKDLEDHILKHIQRLYGNLNILKPTDMYILDKSMLLVNFDAIELVDDHMVPHEIKIVTKYGLKYYNFNKAINKATLPNGNVSMGDQPSRPIHMDPTAVKTTLELIAGHYGIPVYYFLQLQQQLLFTGEDIGYLWVLNTEDWTLYKFLIYADPIIHNYLIMKSNLKWQEVLKIRGEV